MERSGRRNYSVDDGGDFGGRACGVFGKTSLSRLFVCLCMKYLENRWPDLRQIRKKDVFGPSLRRGWKSKVKGQGNQGQISSPLKMHRNALTANNVMQQQTKPFRRCRWVMGAHSAAVCGLCLVNIFMVALCNRADHYIFILRFLLLLSSSSFFLA